MFSKNTRKRSYDESFLKLGFTELNGKPKCVICLKVLSEESMKKNKLQRHLIVIIQAASINQLSFLNKS